MKITLAPRPPDDDLTLTDLCWQNRQVRRRLHTKPPQGTPCQSDLSTNGSQKQALYLSGNIRHQRLLIARKPGKGIHWLFFLGAGMLLFVGAWFLSTLTIIPWFQSIGTHWDYGAAVISQFDFDVGHGGISHFIAQDDHGTVVVIEIIEAGNFHTHVYLTRMFSSNNSIRVVTLSIAPNNNNRSKPNLSITVTGDIIPATLYNTGSAFSTTLSGGDRP